MIKNEEKTRILGRQLARELSAAEIEAISGGHTISTVCDTGSQCAIDDESGHGPGPGNGPGSGGNNHQHA